MCPMRERVTTSFLKCRANYYLRQAMPELYAEIFFGRYGMATTISRLDAWGVIRRETP